MVLSNSDAAIASECLGICSKVSCHLADRIPLGLFPNWHLLCGISWPTGCHPACPSNPEEWKMEYLQVSAFPYSNWEWISHCHLVSTTPDRSRSWQALQGASRGWSASLSSMKTTTTSATPRSSPLRTTRRPALGLSWDSFQTIADLCRKQIKTNIQTSKQILQFFGYRTIFLSFSLFSTTEPQWLTFSLLSPMNLNLHDLTFSQCKIQ